MNKRPVRGENLVCSALAALLLTFVRAEAQQATAGGDTAKIKEIKAYCLDFNWGERRRFAEPGRWSSADPAEHVAWYRAIGAHVIQTFAVSCNGYAWYKKGVVPEQPGLKHDFLPEIVKLGHKEGMLVFGYFCIGSNTRWGKENPATCRASMP